MCNGCVHEMELKTMKRELDLVKLRLEWTRRFNRNVREKFDRMLDELLNGELPPMTEDGAKDG